MNEVLIGASLPFAITFVLYVVRGFRASNRMLVWGPVAMGLSGAWAVVPDMPRLWGDLELYNELHHHPQCWVWYFHCQIDRVETDSPIWSVGFVAVGVLLLVAAWRELLCRERARAG
jgi:hypothetical protein